MSDKKTSAKDKAMKLMRACGYKVGGVVKTGASQSKSGGVTNKEISDAEVKKTVVGKSGTFKPKEVGKPEGAMKRGGRLDKKGGHRKAKTEVNVIVGKDKPVLPVAPVGGPPMAPPPGVLPQPPMKKGGKVDNKATGGAVDGNGKKAPKMTAGALSGKGRLEKVAVQKTKK